MPKAPAIQDTYGWALFKSGQAGKAIAYLEAAAKGMPDDAEIQYHLAAALAASGRQSEALPLGKESRCGHPVARQSAPRPPSSWPTLQ